MTEVREMRKRTSVDADSEECALARKIFGRSIVSTVDDSNDEDDAQTDDEHNNVPSSAEDEESTSQPKPVWHDEDDDAEELVEVSFRRNHTNLRRTTDKTGTVLSSKEYQKRLRDAFSRSQGKSRTRLGWARLKKKKSVEAEDELTSGDESEQEEVNNALKQMTAFTGRCVVKNEFLPKGVINFTKLGDITRGHRFGKKPVAAIQFHPTRPVLMTACESGIISLFEVGLPDNEECFLQDISFKEFPITTAFFTADGLRVLAGSKKREYLFSYDMMEGGITQIRLPKTVTKCNTGHFALSPDGSYLALIIRNEVHILSATVSVILPVVLG
ncbi:hypothetical protein AB6A40_010848 [Gnathostoma spinigerum]|uniref:Uncharacterized protein n=1 Tax=Gnathostoma spinigerum TaxID=75299 RepID=A0ABD6F2C5_9BILA